MWAYYVQFCEVNEMKLMSRIGTFFALLLLMGFAWISVLTMESPENKQLRLISEAEALMDDGIYVRAQPLLEEAIGFENKYREEAEEALKRVYLNLIDIQGYQKLYISLLDRQLARSTATSAQYLELADFYFSINKAVNAITVLRQGAETHGEAEVISRYEAERYAFKYNRVAYDDVTAIFDGTIQVKLQDLWGIATEKGDIMIPCKYEKISTYYNGSAIVMSDDGQIYAVDNNQSKVYITKEPVTDFGNLNDNRITFQSESGLYRGNAELGIATSDLTAIGMYSSNHAAAQMGEKWGIVDTDAEWVIPCEYDAVIVDELGRAVGQMCVFLQQNGTVLLYQSGSIAPSTYEDAKPFAENYAAVKNNGKWGFIDNTGTLVIDYQFDNARSFGDHLAAVEINGKWGYISLSGEVVIEPIFQEAKSFSGGSAPVKTEDGWTFISLIEAY